MDESKMQIEMNIYDQEEIYHNCTAQVLRNLITGEVSVGLWRNAKKQEGENE